MNDEEIIELYWQRSQKAITETEKKYGNYCYHIAYNILRNQEDSEECVNDTYLKAWKAIPPARPNALNVFLGTITRNLSLNKYKYYNAEKRGFAETPCVLEELEECIPGHDNVEQMLEEEHLTSILNQFLEKLKPKTRKIFMRRYWYLSSIKEIAKDFGMSESSIKMKLQRARMELKNMLEKEGIVL